MSADYRHLSYEQRCQIETLKKRGDSVKFIARMLNVDKSTVYRELCLFNYEVQQIDTPLYPKFF